MAKIYETEQDVAREEAAEQAKLGRITQNDMLNTGGLMALLGYTTLKMHDLEAAKIPPAKGFWHKFDKWFGAGMIIAGLGSMGLSLLARSHARNAEKKLEQLGPEEIVLPQAAPAGGALPSDVLAALQAQVQQPCTACKINELLQRAEENHKTH